jgi:hypothetical protein
MSNLERETLLQLGRMLHELRARYDHYGLFNSGRIYQTAFRQFGDDATARSAKIDEMLTFIEHAAMGEETDSTVITSEWAET